MSASAVGFVGGGRIVRIVLGGWQRAGCLMADVTVSDADPNVTKDLQREFRSIRIAPDNREAARQDIVVLAVHPPAFPAVLADIKDALSANATVVSLAPKWPMGKLCGLLGGFNRLARVIPNAPSIVNKGYNPVSFGAQLPLADRQRVVSLLAPLGACPEVPEDTLEAHAILSAMGPTYLWYQLYELVDLGCEFGMTREAATQAVTAMAAGAAATMSGGEIEPAAVMDLIPSKPLAPVEASVKDSYRVLLRAMHEKLKS